MMTIEKAIEVLDEVIPPPDSYLVDLAHAQIAAAWHTIKIELKKTDGRMEQEGK